MEPIRKTSVKPGLKLFLWGILGLIALFILIISIHDRQKIHPVTADLTQEDESIQLMKRGKEELLHFEVKPSFGEGFAIKKSNGVYRVEGQPDFPLEMREIDLMVSELTSLTAFSEVGSNELDELSLNALGLDEKAVRVQAGYADGQTAVFLIGASAPTEIPSDYFMFEGDQQVYTVSTTMKEAFDRELNTLHPVPRLNFNSELVDAVHFEGEGAFVIRQDAGLWQLVSPFVYPADENTVRSLLAAVEKMRLAVYAGPADETHLTRYGFTPSRRTVIFDLADSVITGFDEQGVQVNNTAVEAQTLRFSVGNKIGTIGFYCLYDDAIYQASLASMGLISGITMDELMAKAPINIPINRLRHLTVEKNGESRIYDISLVEKVLPNNEILKDEAGNFLYEPLIQSGGVEKGSEAFLNEYIKLMGLSATGNVPDGFTSVEPAAIRFLLDTASGDLEVAFYSFDALHYAMRVNGVFRHYVQRLSVDDIQL